MTIPNIAFRPRKNFTKISLDEAVNNFKKYLDICKNDSFINKEVFVNQEEPIISAIIPVYNSQETIKLAIRSIQNQDMKNIEIILVNDLADQQKEDILYLLIVMICFVIKMFLIFYMMKLKQKNMKYYLF